MHKSSIEGIRDPRVKTFDVLVRYRTRSGCNAKMITLREESEHIATAKAIARVWRMRAVIGIDSAEICQWAAECPLNTESL